MIKHILLICLSVFLALQCQTQNDGSAVVMTLENEKITLADFDYIFRKNNTETTTSKEDLDEYIELFVNYKLKVKAAKDAQLDTNVSFINELKGYRKQLARPYLTDSDLLDQLAKEAYERKKKEIHAKHILIKVEADAQPEDTLKAWNKINTLRTRIINGEDFEKVAKGPGGSEDPSVKDNGGDLGFFSAFQMVYPFEQGAYNTAEGEISEIVRTRYGYHILQVIESRVARGQVLVAHIMTKAGNTSSQATQQKAEEKIREIYAKFKSGEPFEELARKFSEDNTTAKKGGELPWFGTRKMVKSFEDVSFNLTNIGDVSEPFRTEYGWHIVKKLDEKVIGSYEELKSEIKTKVGKDSRAEQTKNSFLNKLRNSYKIKEKPKAAKHIIKKVDSTFFGREWSMKGDKKLEKTALSIEGRKVPLKNFYKYIKKNKRRANTENAEEYISESYPKWVKEELLNYEDSKLEEKHRPFRMLMQEYRDGILLFELTDELVWSKAIEDTIGLKNFYEANKSAYVWPTRYAADIFLTNTESIANDILSLINDSLPVDSIISVVNETSELNASLQKGISSANENPIFDKLSNTNSGSVELISDEGKFYVVRINQVIPATSKKLEEAKGLITSDYQADLEKRWIQSLREKYNYTVNKDVLYSLINE